MGLAYYKSPIGILSINGDQSSIRNIQFVSDFLIPPSKTLPKEVEKCIDQLDEYFQQERTSFELNIDLRGTVFQKAIWCLLQQIAFGETWSYLQLAKKYGDELSIRAVGKANALNPIAIVVPCHRVVGAKGDLVGYAGGIEKKKWLLNHEKALMPDRQLSLFH